jgi:hypothetical protein
LDAQLVNVVVEAQFLIVRSINRVAIFSPTPERFFGLCVKSAAGRPLPQKTGDAGRGCGDASRVPHSFA